MFEARWRVLGGDCLKRLAKMPDNSVDSIVCDPPYGLSKEPDMMEVLRHWLAGDDYAHTSKGFMGKTWDSFVPGPAIWRECLRVLKPGGHLLAFFGSRTYDMGVLAIRIAGFEVRDQIMWTYGSGFPKSQNISKAIDKKLGVKRKLTGKTKPGHESFAKSKSMSSVTSLKGTMGGKGGFARPWMDNPKAVARYHMETAAGSPEAAAHEGKGTALKPAHEPIVMARKPFKGTVVDNVLKHGTGALNIDGCRVGAPEGLTAGGLNKALAFQGGEGGGKERSLPHTLGRWPANFIHDGSDGVLHLFPVTKSGKPGVRRAVTKSGSMAGALGLNGRTEAGVGDEGSAARFFYCAKVSKGERNADVDNKHPTVKPVDLMRYLVTLVTPEGGVVLDPFFGSGSTGVAAIRAGYKVIGIEREPDYRKIAVARLKAECRRVKRPKIVIKAKRKTKAKRLR